MLKIGTDKILLYGKVFLRSFNIHNHLTNIPIKTTVFVADNYWLYILIISLSLCKYSYSKVKKQSFNVCLVKFLR